MVILTEKPSVAKSIGEALNFTKDKNNNWYISSDKQSCIVSAHGHLLELYSPEDYAPESNTKGWSLKQLPIIPTKMLYKKIPTEKGLPDSLSIISNALKTFGEDNFVLATDAEREGELIGYLILQHLNFSEWESAKRFWTSEALTKDVVCKEMKNLKPLLQYQHYRQAGLARQHADWLIGINFTRLLSVQSNTLLPFGRVQTAVLGAIFIRENSILNFIPQKYIQLRINAQKANKTFSMFFTVDKETRLNPDDKNISECIEHIKNNPKIIITEIITQEKKENPPLLFDITELQKFCSDEYEFSPAKTLEIAQILYEKYKCLSYPRTPSNVLGDDNVDLFKEKYNLLKNHYPQLAHMCANEKITVENKRIFNSQKLTDHHALIPLDILPEVASTDERKVYKAVLQRFFDIIKPPYIYEAQKVTAKTTDNKFCFTASGEKIIQYGWRDNKKNDDQEQTLPELQENDALDIIDHEILNKTTKPLPHYTNSTLLALMKNPRKTDESKCKLVGLGTPATRAGIIQGLHDRKLIYNKKNNILITEKGIFLIKQILKIPELTNLISISTTTEWEEALAEDPDLFINKIRSFITENLPNMKLTGTYTEKSIICCPLCSGKIIKTEKNYFCSNFKNGCHFSVFRKIAGSEITDKDISDLIQNGKTRKKKFTSKAGKEFKCRLKLSKTEKSFVQFDFS